MNDCIFCGKQLSEKEETIGCGICIDCQSKHFSKLEEENGCHLAIFICCAAYDIPCEPLLCPIDLVNFDGNRWEKYIDILFENGELGGKTEKTFFSGVCDIRRVFGKNLSESDFARYISVEQERIGKLPGSSRQHAVYSVVIALVCGVAGLICAYYLDTTAGAAIVLFAAVCYAISLGIRALRK